MIVNQLVQQASQQLDEFDTATLDAQLLLAHVLGKDRTWLYTWSDAKVSAEHQETFKQLVSRRFHGEPIAHILGYREFWNLELECDASTLIPRPETEHLVETALDLNLPDRSKVLDLGTGTGAIALALGSERPEWNIDAVDFSDSAITLAKRNALKNHVGNVCFFQSDWFQAIQSRVSYNLVVSNPPYIDPESEWLIQGDVRFEPKTALISDHQGMADIEKIITNAPTYLQPEGWLVLEHGFDQQEPVQNCFRHHHYRSIFTVQDLAGLPRISYAQYIP